MLSVILKASVAIAVLIVVSAAWWLILGLPLYWDLLFAAFALVGLFASFFYPIGVTLGGISALISLSVIAIVTQWVLPPQFGTYRDHERYARSDAFLYQANQEAVINQPHGDLLAIDPFAPNSLSEPRTVYFKTDSFGYRNRHDYAGESNLLVGDSFVVANGTSQEFTLNEQLAVRRGVNSYNLGFPSGPNDYGARTKFEIERMKIRPEAKFHIFIYEGNDFGVPPEDTARGLPVAYRNPLIAEVWATKLDEYEKFKSEWRKKIIPDLRVTSLMNGLARRAEAIWIDRHRSSVLVGKVKGRQIGLFTEQTIAALTLHPILGMEQFEGIWPKVGCVFFIPTAARVYDKFLEQKPWTSMPQPPPTLKLISDTLQGKGIPLVDLTPSLVSYAEHASADKLPYWADDTHWNANGIAAVVDTVADCIEGRVR